MPSAIIPLQNIILVSTATSVTFGSIPATMRDLKIVVNAATSTQGNLQIRVNNDSGNNYSQVRMSAYNGGTNSTSIITNSLVTNVATGLQPTSRATNIYEILDYSATDKHKSIICRAGHSDEIDLIVARWANTAAITSVTILPGSTFAVGSSFSLYGVLA